MHITSKSCIDITSIPEECIRDCSHAGQCDEDVAHWREKLTLTVDRHDAIRYLATFGAWDESELDAMSDTDLADRILWDMCCTFKEYICCCEHEGLDYALVEEFDASSGSNLFAMQA